MVSLVHILWRLSHISVSSPRWLPCVQNSLSESQTETSMHQEVPECNEELQDKGKNRDWKEAEMMAHHKAGENTAMSDRKRIIFLIKA